MPASSSIKIQIIKSDERGLSEHGWLRSRHTFSFGNYYDPARPGFRSLRVINEDIVEAGQGFGTHPHRDMEIISYVVEGELEHKDSMGHGSVIRKGDIQRISAGTGITHSEFNPSSTKSVHFLQIWIIPDTKGRPPSYEERTVSELPEKHGLRLLASPDGSQGSVKLLQDARMYLGDFEDGRSSDISVGAGRGIWIQLIDGRLRVADRDLQTGDGVSIENAETISLTGAPAARFLLFDLN